MMGLLRGQKGWQKIQNLCKQKNEYTQPFYGIINSMEIPEVRKIATKNSDRSPAINKTAFSCPHCYTHTTHTWYNVYLDQISDAHRIPEIIGIERIRALENNKEIPEDIREN